MFRSDRRPPAPGQTIRAAGLHLHGVSSGRGGPPLLLLHGYLSSTSIWSAATSRLAEEVRTVAIDLPGCGYSERPLDAPYDLPWLADAVLAAMDALDLDRPVLGGHSFGAALALHLAARVPNRIAGLLLVSPPAYAPPPPPGLKLARRHPLAMRTFFASPVGRLCIPALIRRAGFARQDVEVRDRTRRLLAHLDAPGGWEAATTMGLQLADHSPGSELLAQVPHPALVVWGRDDRVHPSSVARRLAADLAGPTRLCTLERAGHNVHEERPRAFADAVLDWLTDEVQQG